MKKVFYLLLSASLVILPGCKSKTGGTSEQLSGSIKIDGSSTVYPLTEAMAEEFRNTQPGVQVTSGVSGTGGGFKKFDIKEIDICDASRPIKAEEIAACKESGVEFIELPVAFDGLAIVVSKDNDFVDHLTVAELKMIWQPEAQEKIKSWKQVRPTFPDVPLHLYGPGTSSGTFDYFTEAIVGKAKSSRGDFTASEDDNILVQGVSGDKGGLAYFGLSYYEENMDKLKLIPIDDNIDSNGKGPILPSAETVLNCTYQPLARPLFIYVNAEAAKRPEVKAYVSFYMQNAAKLAKDVGFIPLTDEIYQLALKHFENSRVGTMFADKSPVGVNLAELLKDMSQ